MNQPTLQTASFRSVHPADGTELAVYEQSTWADIEAVLDRSWLRC